ncbi:metallophosphoesterase [Bacillus sp. S10(2024)]|uniref:metallophosphoesterase n=1 Tax=Bacillus sp. S10(2024) TaxID=3162886 RepID=UPI003D24DC9E
MEKIKELSIPNNVRIIVISDIHGELELFKALLEKVKFSKEDYLIINGDLCEKGSNSKGVVNYVMELSFKNPNVHVIEGNCDTVVEELLNENPHLINYLCTKQHSILNEWLEHIGYFVSEDTNIREIKEILENRFSKEIKWLTELPTAIETDDYIFIHAGLDEIENWKDTNRDTAITLPAFLHKSHRANKYVIVGHWPVVNYSSELPSDNPIIEHTKKIISIDGGNAIKETGQLNAFIIHKSSSEDTFSHTYVDHFPKYKVLEDFCAEPMMSGLITYPRYEIIPVKKGKHFTLCEQLEAKQLLNVKNEYIHQNEAGSSYAKTDVSCAQIGVNKGDTVSIIDDSCTGYDLIKRDGVVGWVAKGILASEMEV